MLRSWGRNRCHLKLVVTNPDTGNPTRAHTSVESTRHKRRRLAIAPQPRLCVPSHLVPRAPACQMCQRPSDGSKGGQLGTEFVIERSDKPLPKTNNTLGGPHGVWAMVWATALLGIFLPLAAHFGLRQRCIHVQLRETRGLAKAWRLAER